MLVPSILLLLLAAGSGHAQGTPTGVPSPEWIQPSEVPTRSDELLRRLEAALPDTAVQASVQKIERQLPQLSRDLDAAMERASQALDQAAAPVELEDDRRELERIGAPLGDWKDELTSEADRVAAIFDELARSKRIWTETRGRSETIAAGDVVVQRIDKTIEALDNTIARLDKWRTQVLATSERVLDRIAANTAASDRLRAASAGEQASLFVPDHPPLWSRGLAAQAVRELPRVPEEILAFTDNTVEYVERDPRPLFVQLLIGALLMFGLKRFSSRALERLAGDDAAARAARLLERPYAIGLLLILIATPALHPLAPRRFVQLVAMVALIPAARIVTHASEGVSLKVFAGLFVLLLLDRIGLALQALPAIERIFFLLMLAVGIGLAFWLSRRPLFTDFGPWLRRAANLAMIGLAVSLAAEIGGWTYLATLLGRGILASAIVALYVYAAAIGLAALFAYLLASQTLHRSRLLGRNTAALQWRAERVVRWLGLGVWLYFVAMSLGLRSTLGDLLRRALNAGVSVGELSLSIGGVLAFVVTLIAAILLARVITLVLEEDVYPRTHLPRGVPYTISTFVRYTFYSLGFLCALAAAGVQLGQVAIMVGGLGIGIGLGLQDLVKNFAAGVTMLIERRVHVGDALEIPSQDILGRVLSIGMRATVIRTWGGAEVVVPNGDLISNSITNWTLSDSLYRIEVPVGVAYGTDPDRVIGVLLDAARSTDKFLAEPNPQALFTGFGDSSLNFVLRAWTDQGYDHALSLTSQLALSVHRVLYDAGITIPFPQRDLHVVSVTPDAGAALSGGERPD